jgi:hypothetical protein
MISYMADRAGVWVRLRGLARCCPQIISTQHWRQSVRANIALPILLSKHTCSTYDGEGVVSLGTSTLKFLNDKQLTKRA